MPLRLGTNTSAINAARNLNKNTADFVKRVERLSSGLRINRGADDAAGLSVSEGFRAELLGMKQGVRNAGQGISLIQLAEGSLNEVSAMLTRMRELAVSSATSTINDSNRSGLTAEFNQLFAEIDRIALSTTYNKQTLLTGFGNAVSQNASASTALKGFAGVTEIGISGAVPGTYIFTDSSDQDNQITLSIQLADGTSLSQTIDVGTALDRDGSRNLVATGTTFVANFDRLGMQVILSGAGVSPATTLRSTVSAVRTDGNLIVGTGDNAISVPVTTADDLTTVAAALDAALKAINPPGFAVFDARLNEIQIETAGNAFGEIGADGSIGQILGTVQANAYVDGRLDGQTILVSTSTGGVLQVGPNDSANNRISLNIRDMRASGPVLNLTGLSVANLTSARGAIERVDRAIIEVARQRGDLGAVQNRLEFTSRNLGNAIENLGAAESAIRDADVAEEVSKFTRAQILTQAATAMLAQANSLPQTALQLLQ